MLRNLIRILGGGTAALGATAIAYNAVSPLDTSGSWWVKVISLILGGAGIFGTSFLKSPNWSWLSNLGVSSVATDTGIPKINNVEQIDLDCIFHLSERAKTAKNTKMLELCKSIQTELFDFHHKIETT